MRIGHYFITKEFPRGSVQFARKVHFKNKEIIGLEIGVLRGLNAKSILKELNIKKLYLIDPYDNYEEEYFKGGKWHQHMEIIEREMFKNLTHEISWGKVVLIRKKSEEAIKDIKEKVDFIYIDGNHDYKYIKKDLENYWNLLNKDGIIAGNDFNLYPVAKAVIEFVEKKKLKLNNWGDDFYIIK